ncbi:hypothetical protein N7467_011897 [Penicillium canescens]|nr:hypothetical protein N7467_011897 [Penicillium canescens]
MFEIEGCGNLEPEHRVAAIIEQDVLRKALTKSNLTREDLLDPTNQPNLILEGEDLITCVYGKHRLKAGERFGETIWLVDLYRDDISIEALAQLREESTESIKFTVGEIYRTLRSYQISQNAAQEQKWWARLGSEDCRKQVRRLQRDTHRRDILDMLLPYVGLWKPLRSSQITRMLGLKCPEILLHYLRKIYEMWKAVVNPQWGSVVDSDSVLQIEGLMPNISLADRRRVTDLMDSKRIFPLITIPEDREKVKTHLLQTPGRIISLNTLLQDTLFLEEPAKALHRLCPPKFKGSFKKAMLSQWNLIGAAGILEIQTAEHKFTKMKQTEHSFSISMIQLWLFACRHFVHQRSRARKNRHHFEWPTKDVSLSRLATLASRLGFKSEQISLLQNNNLGQLMAQGFFKSLCREEFYEYKEYKVQSMSNKLQSFLQNLPRYVEEEDATAQFTTNDPELEASHRFNSPTRDEYDRQRKHMFANQLFGRDQPQSQYVTSLGVTKDIIGCFFGKTLFQQLWEQNSLQSSYSPESMEVDTAGSAEERPAVHPLNSPPVEVPQSSVNSGLDVIKDDDRTLELDNHPSGTPDRDAPPLAAGFEETSQQMEIKNYLSTNRTVSEMLSEWYQSRQELILVYLFESRIYYKFFLAGGSNLRANLRDLARKHVLMVANEHELVNPDMNEVYEAALKHRLVLVAKKDNPSHERELEGTISLDKLREYFLNYDIHTGKRKADSTANRSGKRHKDGHLSIDYEEEL